VVASLAGGGGSARGGCLPGVPDDGDGGLLALPDDDGDCLVSGAGGGCSADGAGACDAGAGVGVSRCFSGGFDPESHAAKTHRPSGSVSRPIVFP
jgi:hypothetical protein